MGFYIYDRMGGQDRYGDTTDVEAVVMDLLEQLQEDPNDQEHTEVSIHNGDWYLAAHVSGLVRLGNNSWIEPGSRKSMIPTLYMRATRKSQVSTLLKLMAMGEIEKIQKSNWLPKEKLPAAKKDLFR